MEHSRTEAWAERPGILTCLLMLGLVAMSIVPAACFLAADLVRRGLGIGDRPRVARRGR